MEENYSNKLEIKPMKPFLSFLHQSLQNKLIFKKKAKEDLAKSKSCNQKQLI